MDCKPTCLKKTSVQFIFKKIKQIKVCRIVDTENSPKSE